MINPYIYVCVYVWAATFSTNMDVNGNSDELPSGKLTYGPWGIIREKFRKIMELGMDVQ